MTLIDRLQFSNNKQCRQVQIDAVEELPRNFDLEEAVASSKSDANDYCPQHDNRIELSKIQYIFLSLYSHHYSVFDTSKWPMLSMRF